MSRGDDVLTYLLGRWVYKEQVRDLAIEAGLSASGTKDEIVVRIIDSGSIGPVDVMSYVPVEGLRDCCETFGLESTGNRDILVDRLSQYVRKSWASAIRRSKNAKRTRPSDGKPELPVIHLSVNIRFWEWAAPSVIAIVIGLVAADVLVPMFGLFGIVISLVVALTLFGAVWLILSRRLDGGQLG